MRNSFKTCELGESELNTVLSFLCERLPTLARPPPHEYASVLDALDIFVQRLMADESLHATRAKPGEPSAVASAVSELTRAVFASAGGAAAGKAIIDHADPSRADGPPAPPDLEAYDASSPPRVFSRVLSSERLALRPMLPAPIATRSMPYEVIQSTLQRRKDSTNALMADSEAWAGVGRSLSRETVGPLSPSASTRQLIVVPSPSQIWTREEYVPDRLSSARGSALFAATSAEDAADGAGAQTMIESCESYLELLREQQRRLRAEREDQMRQLEQPPPVPGWYAIKSPAFGTNLQRARSWAEPSEFDWWRTQ